MSSFKKIDLEYYKSFRKQEFLTLVSDEYQIDIDKLSALFKDFDLIERDFLGMGDLDPVQKSMELISKETALSKKAIRRLQHLQLISRPISYNDFDFLSLINSACCDAYFMRCMLSRFSYQQLEKFFRRPELTAKWERWAYTTHLNNKIEYGDGGRMLNPAKRIRIYDLAETIESMFGVPNCANTRTRLEKIREMASNDRKRSKKIGVGVETLAERRGISAEELRMALGLWEPPT